MSLCPAQTAQATQLTQRWDALLADIGARYDQILRDAVAGSESLIAQIAGDFGALTRPWSAVEHQLHQHTEQISDGWDDVSDALSELDELPDEVMDTEGNKRDLATCDLEIRYYRAYWWVMGRAAEVMRQRALATDAAAHACTQCGATLDRVTPVSQALNVACSYCQAVNTVDPGPALRMLGASGAMFLGEVAAFCAWETMKRAEAHIDLYRRPMDVPRELLTQYQSAANQYWTTRLGVEAQHVPEQQQYVAQKIERYMHDVNKKLRRHPQWQ